MAFTAGTLADGQVATSVTALYTVPGATTAYLKSVTFLNTNAATQTLIVSVKRSGGTSRKVRQYTLAQNESADYIEPGSALLLSTGDAVEAITTTGTAVDYTVSGVLET